MHSGMTRTEFWTQRDDRFLVQLENAQDKKRPQCNSNHNILKFNIPWEGTTPRISLYENEEAFEKEFKTSF